jgi:hypothetical protein
MRGKAKSYNELLAYCQSVPLVDCHDHAARLGPKYTDPIQVIIGEYFLTDLASATSEATAHTLLNQEIPWEERWPILEMAWQRSRHTGFAQVTRRVLKKFYDEDDVTLEGLRRMAERLLDLEDRATYEAILDEAKIAVRLADVWPDVNQVLDGTFQLTPRARLVIPLPAYHRIRDFMGVQELVAPLGRKVITLDEYLAACREIFEGFKAYGAVAFKDQSAYFRPLNYSNPTRAEAEKVFNWFMEDPLRSASYPDGVQPLDDYLFHAFMRIARDIDLPVQVHTGHLAGLYGDITKANAAGLANLLMLHNEVRFDLFHANWPYSGEILFLAKVYPNVTIDFCWTNVIDPVYSQVLFRQALSSVPHSKIHGYGSDFGGFGYPPGGGYVDRAWAHAQIARENVAIALSDMVEIEYLSLHEAKEVAYAWLFGNANEFYRLEL